MQHTTTGARSAVLLIILLILLLILIMLDLMTGSVKIPLPRIVDMLFGRTEEFPIWNTILFDFRIPKTLTAILAGSALSVSGLQMQTVFRNPLAGPDVLGVTAGASLGVAMVVLGFGDFFLLHNMNHLGSWTQIIAAWAGAGLVLLLIMFVAMRVRDIMTILILGILFGSAASAIVSILQYFSQQSVLKAFVIWSMGSLGSLTGIQLRMLAFSLAFGFLLTLLALKVLNALLLGETYSRSLGVSIRRSRLLIFLSTSILSGSVTAFCGPIAFVGIAVPHLARLIFNTANHHVLVPASLILGSMLMLLADLISQMPGSGILLPINSVTALLGIPVVIWVIVYNRRLTGIS
ncbi:MAG: iron ABC transporter permease [Bacteroidales bacterium]|nr:iron ABC transporter permease [Bacteroidales bacterium]